MSAIRLARGFTGRDLVVKFEGCYHGHVDSLLVKAGSGMAHARHRRYARRAEELLRYHHRAAVQFHRGRRGGPSARTGRRSPR